MTVHEGQNTLSPSMRYHGLSGALSTKNHICVLVSTTL